MSESRRLDNRRLKRELRLRLRYPTVADGLRAATVPSRLSPAAPQDTLFRSNLEPFPAC